MTAACPETRRPAAALHGGADTPQECAETTVDYNVHGLLGIRLLNPSTDDVRTVGRQVGLAPAAFEGEPAITIRFVDELPVHTTLRYLGREDVGFTGDSFVIIRSRNLARARAQIAFESIGNTCEISCEKGLPAIPLLRPLMNFAMLARGIVPVHATGFNYEGHGVLVTGWSHGSKTGTLLSFMAAGAKFIGDEWIYLCASRNRMYGLPDHLEARPWYLRELPRFWRHVNSGDRFRLAATERLARMLAPFVPAGERRNSLTAKLVRHAHQTLLDQQSVHLQPIDLFGPAVCTLASELDTVIVVISSDAPDVVVEPTPIEHVAKQMAASFQHEQGSLLSCYQKHLFAFPERRNELLDKAEHVYFAQTLHALSGKRIYTLLHPYPVSTQTLRNAIRPLLRGDETSAGT